MHLRLVRLFLGFVSLVSFAAAELSPLEQKIAAQVASQQDAFVAELTSAVKIDSATENLAGIRQVAELHAAQLRELGFTVRYVEQPAAMKRGGHLIAERTGTRGKRLLLIGHLDTVLPGGSVRREGNRLYGAGSSDMKGGNLVVIHALRALHAVGALEDTQITVIFTGDEEAPGNPIEQSRRDLRELAARSDVALAFETGTAKTVTVARRGIVSWQLEVQGATGHSSGLWGDAMGSGAVYEMSRILAGFHEVLRKMDGITCNPALVVGGTEAELTRTGGTVSGKGNIVAQRALVRGDLRFLSASQLAEAQRAMQEVVKKHLPRTSAELRFSDDGYPAMEATPANFALAAELDRASRDLGAGEVQPGDPKSRGAGDVSFVSPPLPAIDGIGIRGGGAHAPGEYADLASVPTMVSRTAVLIHRLTR